MSSHRILRTIYLILFLIYASSVVLSSSGHNGVNSQTLSISHLSKKQFPPGMTTGPRPPQPPGPPDPGGFGANDFSESDDYTKATNISILAMACVISIILSSSAYALLYIFYLKRDLPRALKTVAGPHLVLKEDDTHLIGEERPEAVTISCSHLCYWVDKPLELSTSTLAEKFKRKFPFYISPRDQRVQILYDVSASFKPGTLTAIMGPSGAGKTTLLNLLGGRMKDGYVSGKRIFNGVPIQDIDQYQEIMRRKSGYVLQTETLFKDLTVEETVIFAAMLRLPSSKYEDATTALLQQLGRVTQVLSDVGLNTKRIRTTPVGDQFTPGISGGQRRRLSIAIELLNLQPVLLLDEPTSGLDATAAAKLVYLLKSLATKRNKTIITTIHSPRPESFNVFDNLLLLESGGKVVYHGPAQQAVNYFYDQGFTGGFTSVSQIDSPGDYIIDVVGLDPTVQEQIKEQQEQQEDENEGRMNNMIDIEQSSGQTDSSVISPPTSPSLSLHSEERTPPSTDSTETTPATTAPPADNSTSSESIMVSEPSGSQTPQPSAPTVTSPRGLNRQIPRSRSTSTFRRTFTLAQAYERSEQHEEVLRTVQQDQALSRSSSSASIQSQMQKDSRTQERNGLWEEALILFSRRFTRYMSNPRDLMSLMMQVILTGLVLGLAFAGKEYTVSFWYTPYKSLMFIITVISYAMIFQYLSLVPEIFEERAILRREIENGSCRLSSYILSTFFWETPLCTVQVFILAAIGYWLVDLNSASHKIAFFLLLSIIGVCAWQSVVCFCCFLTNDIGAVFRGLFVILGLGELFGGVVITKENLGYYFLPFFYTSVPALTYRALLRNDLQCCTMIFTCKDVHDIENKYPNEATYLDSLNNTYCTVNGEETQLFNLGEATLSFLDLKDEPVGADVFALVITLFGLRLLAIVSYKIHSWLEMRLKVVDQVTVYGGQESSVEEQRLTINVNSSSPPVDAPSSPSTPSTSSSPSSIPSTSTSNSSPVVTTTTLTTPSSSRYLSKYEILQDEEDDL